MKKTPHIVLTDEIGFGRTVLMPGDPLRSKFIAERFLESPVLVNNVRGINGYTGFYRGVKVSVMASGMGMPSIGIYSYELFNFFGVENIIRVGSAGALQENIELRDLVLGIGACTDSAFPSSFGMPGTLAPTADYKLLSTAAEKAESAGLRYHVANLLSSDSFYNDDPERTLKWSRMGVAAVEMEAAALYCQALRAGKRALAICTISDHIIKGDELDAEARQTSFTDMMRLALDTALEAEHF